jgi:hypothetical protein
MNDIGGAIRSSRLHGLTDKALEQNLHFTGSNPSSTSCRSQLEKHIFGKFFWPLELISLKNCGHFFVCPHFEGGRAFFVRPAELISLKNCGQFFSCPHFDCPEVAGGRGHFFSGPQS